MLSVRVQPACARFEAVVVSVWVEVVVVSLQPACARSEVVVVSLCGVAIRWRVGDARGDGCRYRNVDALIARSEESKVPPCWHIIFTVIVRACAHPDDASPPRTNARTHANTYRASCSCARAPCPPPPPRRPRGGRPRGWTCRRWSGPGRPPAVGWVCQGTRGVSQPSQSINHLVAGRGGGGGASASCSQARTSVCRGEVTGGRA